MGSAASPFNLQTCARRNILELKPYRCARDDYKDDGTNILLDANENAHGPGLARDSSRLPDRISISKDDELNLDIFGLNRYPDPHQVELKEQLCAYRNQHVHTKRQLKPENLFVGVGSDEAIDALLRCFCNPGRDKILTCPPTYGMYAVSAQVNDIGIVHVPLDVEGDFALQPDLINDKLSSNPSIKMVYICSPGNPTGGLISKTSVQKVLEHPTWNGVVIIDEAYIDFSPDGCSLAEWVLEWPNLVVMQTLSKAFGLAGIRLGTAFCSAPIATLLNSLKAPYNISSPTSALARAAFCEDHLNVMRQNRSKILDQRNRMVQELPKIAGIGRIRGGQDGNFLLVEMLNGPKEHGGKPDNVVALKVYETMAEKKGVVIRFRGKEVGCLGCLRITVGTPSEVDQLLKDIATVLRAVHDEAPEGKTRDMKSLEQKASSVVT